VQDLVVRGGARNATIEVTDSEEIELDGVTS
jgi:hypothetical protein